MGYATRKRRATPHARLATVRRLAVAECVVSLTAVGLALSRPLLESSSTAGESWTVGRYELVSTLVSLWCGLAAWRDCSSGVSRLLDPKLLSSSVDHHLARAVVAGGAVMLLSWGAMRAPDATRRRIVSMAVAMQLLATLCVVSMFVLRNTFNHMLVSAGSHVDSDVEGSDVEGRVTEMSPCCPARERRQWLSQTLPRGWRQHAPHRQGIMSSSWEPPRLPLLGAPRADASLGLTTLEEEMSPMLSTPMRDDGPCSPARSSQSPHAAATPGSACSSGERSTRHSRSLSFDQQRKAGNHSRSMPCTPPSGPLSPTSDDGGGEEDDPLSSPCSAGGTRRSSPGRMSVWALRDRMRDVPPTDDNAPPVLVAPAASSEVRGSEQAHVQSVAGLWGTAESAGQQAASAAASLESVQPRPLSQPLHVVDSIGQVQTESPL